MESSHGAHASHNTASVVSLDERTSEGSPNEEQRPSLMSAAADEEHKSSPSFRPRKPRNSEIFHPTLTDFGPQSATSYFRSRYSHFDFHARRIELDDISPLTKSKRVRSGLQEIPSSSRQLRSSATSSNVPRTNGNPMVAQLEEVEDHDTDNPFQDLEVPIPSKERESLLPWHPLSTPKVKATIWQTNRRLLNSRPAGWSPEHFDYFIGPKQRSEEENVVESPRKRAKRKVESKTEPNSNANTPLRRRSQRLSSRFALPDETSSFIPAKPTREKGKGKGRLTDFAPSSTTARPFSPNDFAQFDQEESDGIPEQAFHANGQENQGVINLMDYDFSEEGEDPPWMRSLLQPLSSNQSQSSRRSGPDFLEASGPSRGGVWPGNPFDPNWNGASRPSGDGARPEKRFETNWNWNEASVPSGCDAWPQRRPSPMSSSAASDEADETIDFTSENDAGTTTAPPSFSEAGQISPTLVSSLGVILRSPGNDSPSISLSSLGQRLVQVASSPPTKRVLRFQNFPPTEDGTLLAPFDYEAYFERVPLAWALDSCPNEDHSKSTSRRKSRDKDSSATVQSDLGCRAVFNNIGPQIHSRTFQYGVEAREWIPKPLPCSLGDPLPCPLSNAGKGWPRTLPQDMYREIAQYLSLDDVKNLRLVNREMGEQLKDLRFQSVVVPFGPQLFGIDMKNLKNVRRLDTRAIIVKNARMISKFAISFEVDLKSLMHATNKAHSRDEKAWWGTFSWPVSSYPRYEELGRIEDLADSSMLLRSAMKGLEQTTELGLSIDSGHGWLNGIDLSDLQVWDLRCSQDEVFGPNFPAQNKWHSHGRDEIFRCAQQKSIDFVLAGDSGSKVATTFKNIPIRTFKSFQNPVDQPIQDQFRHTGGHRQNTNADDFPYFMPYTARRKANSPRLPQYPLIFNGLNIAQDIICHDRSLMDHIATQYPLLPGSLTEAQAQWLLETAWAQRAFISSWVTSVIHNKAILKQVHSLHFSKLSSGLMSNLGHDEFWKALPQLHTLTLIVIPDWRKSHEPGDTAFNSHMQIQPSDASVELANLLRMHVSPLENISNLKVGFFGGGEHAKGLLARNQHILPAPLVSNPKSWVSDHQTVPELSTMISLEHVQKLTIVNAWLSPLMIQTYMNLSKDSSLKHLILDSVSLTIPHGNKNGQPYNRETDSIDCHYPPELWLHEITPCIPDSCAWTRVINQITPGRTFDEHRLAAKVISEEAIISRDFPGNVANITFNSCGYVKISGFAQTEYNQNWLVVPTSPPGSLGDDGLEIRRSLLQSHGSMKPQDGSGRDYPLLGKMTQCVHPVEKVVLERAYGFTFGWGDDMRRWDSVEDGCFEGGTGRFSGTISKDDKLVDEQALGKVDAAFRSGDRDESARTRCTNTGRNIPTIPTGFLQQNPHLQIGVLQQIMQHQNDGDFSSESGSDIEDDVDAGLAGSVGN